MMYCRLLAIFYFILILPSTVFSQKISTEDYRLFVNLKDAPFDSLFLFDYTNNRNILFKGDEVGEQTWLFRVPDSVIQDSEHMILLVSKYDSLTNSSRNVRFVTGKFGKSAIVSNIGFEDRSTFINALYKEQTVFKNNPVSRKINNKDSTIAGKTVCEDFELILEDDSSDIAIRAQEPYFSWFMSYGGESNSYEKYFSSYLSLSEKYPDSRYLISYLSMNLNNYKSKQDVKRIYDNLSDKHKNTKWSKVIDRFLYGKFPNILLHNLETGTSEKVIQDSSKYNLIVFSASWCKPCIEEIPLLKKIHQDLNDNLNIIVVSIDKESGLRPFQKLMQENDVSWRSLYAYKSLDEVMELYFINGIPHAILVHPKGDMEIIEIRNDNQRAKMYRQVSS